MLKLKHRNKVADEWGDGDAEQSHLAIVLDNIEELVREDPQNLQDLANLVESLPEDNEHAISNKLLLAQTLVGMKYEQIKKFLVRLINMPMVQPISNPETPEEYNRKSNRSNQRYAASMLIQLEDERGKQFITKFMETAIEEEKESIVLALQSIVNHLAINLLFQLAAKDKYIASEIDRERAIGHIQRIGESPEKYMAILDKWLD